MKLNRIIATIILAALIFPAAVATQELDSAHATPTKRDMSQKKKWGVKDSRREIKDAAKFHGVPKKRLPLLQRWSYDIVWGGEAKESSGDTRCNTRKYAGKYQFLKSSWKQSPKEKRAAKKEKHYHYKKNWRYCGVCSTRRWVRLVRDYCYNYSKVRFQWPTLGR